MRKIGIIMLILITVTSALAFSRYKEAEAASGQYYGGFSIMMWYCNESNNWWHLLTPFYYNGSTAATAVTTSGPTGVTRYANYFLHAGGWSMGQFANNQVACENYYGYYYFTLPALYTFDEATIGTSP